MVASEIKEYEDMIGKEDSDGFDAYIKLYGYTSTSLCKQTGLSFMWEKPETGH